MLCQATQVGWVTVKSSDKTWPTGEGNANQLHYSCLKNPMDSMKRQKDMTPEDKPPGQKVFNMLLGKSEGQLLIVPVRMKHLGQSRNDAQLWVCLVVKVQCYKEQYCTGTRNVRSMNQGKPDIVKQEVARKTLIS